MKYLKRFLFFLLIINFLEIVFAFSIFSSIVFSDYINIFLYSIMVSAILSILSGIFSNKVNIIITSIILFILGVIFSIQLVFYNVFKAFFSFSILGLTDQLNSFMGETLKAIIDNIIYIIIFLLPFIIYLIFKNKINLLSNNKYNYLIYFSILLIGIGVFMIRVNTTDGEIDGVYSLYHDTNNIALNMKKLGVSNSYLLDIYRAIFGFEDQIVKVEKESEEKIVQYEKNALNLSFDKETSNSEIKKINEYMQNNSGTFQNSYTGIFKDYNLIYIVAESFSNIAVSPTLTPTLYKLTHTGFIFDNFYTPNTLSTIGGEFQALTGLYPDSSILGKWRSGNNYFPYGLGTIYKDLGYKTYAYHNNWYGFQDRHKYLKSQGFSNYLGCYNGLEKRMNCSSWPQSDLEMMKVTVNDYINNEEPFLAYYMSVSGHFSYNFSDNSMASKNRKYVSDLNVSTAAKAYVATQIELDRALEYLLQKLEETGKLDNTIIVLMADHYPYKLSLSDVNSLSDYERDSVVEVNHNALILWNNNINDIHINKVCMSSDVLPTIYNLFGIKYDSRLFTGNDILSDTPGIAIMSNHSWVTDKGTYFSSNSKFTPKEEVEDNYVSNVNSIVKNRLSIAKMIIKNNYYNYLMK